MSGRDFRDYRVGEHDFPLVLNKNGIDFGLLHQDVRDVDEWIKRVIKLAKTNDIDDYTLQQVEGAAFEHLVECVIERYGNDSGEVDSFNVGATRRGEPGIDLIAETHDGKAHLHQCKFIKKTSHNLGMAEIESFDQTEIGSNAGVRKTLWTTAKGVNTQVQMNHRGVIQYLSIDWLRETLDGDDGFWEGIYAKSLGATPERRIGEIDASKLDFTNREYQLKALERFKKEVATNSVELKGRFVYPTGAGKTLIESLILNHQMERNKEFGLHVVVAPRIALLTQLMREYRNYIGDKYDQIGFHSNDHKNEGRDYDKYLNLSTQRKTTDENKVLREVERASRNNVPLVIFSTYHSLHKLVRDGLSFETMIADESQYCISRNFFRSVQSINAKVKLYFTATEYHGSEDMGERRNNNEKAFGKVLGEEAIQVLVDRGILAEPKLHLLLASSRDADPDIIDIDETKDDAIARHLVCLAKNIAEKQRDIVNSALYSKTLFSCRSAEHVRIIASGGNLKMLKDAVPDHTIFTIVSNSAPKIDGKSVNRGEFLQRLKDHKGNALIFHYDILAEGIDIDGITGVAILRKTRQAKTLQTIGRCLRPFKADPSLKPHAFVSVPVIDGKKDYSGLLENVITRMLTCGLDVNADTIIYDSDHKKQDTEPRPRPEPSIPPSEVPIIQDEFEFVRHRLIEIKRNAELEIEELEHKVVLTQEVTKKFIDDLLCGVYRPDGKPLNDTLRSLRNRHCIVDEVWVEGKKRIKDSEMRPITPLHMIKDHVSRLGDISGKLTLTFNVEYVPYLNENGANVTLATREYCEATKNLAESQVIEAKYLTLEEVMKKGMKFDVVIGNPPYQETGGSGNPIWQEFVERGLNVLVDGGHLAMIHPPAWRGTGDIKQNIARISNMLKRIDFEWISMHDIPDGTKNFKAGTAYDMYVARKSNTPNFITEIRGTDGSESRTCIKSIDIVPNFDFGLVQGLIAKEGEEKVNFIYSAVKFETRKKWMSKVETDEFCHRCVYSISRTTGKLKFRYSNTQHPKTRKAYPPPFWNPEGNFRKIQPDRNTLSRS